MPETEPSRGAARATEPTEGPSLTFDLAEQIASLRQEPYWQSGRNSKTIVKYPDFRIVLTAIKANTTIHEHHSAGRISVQTVEGHIQMHAGGKEFDCRPDDFWCWIVPCLTMSWPLRTAHFC